jgi:CDP-diacylglycerol--glycerol-3-phosphate 3-phosphatidyltransferase
MNLADRFTFSRIILAPVFFAVYFLPLLLPAQYANIGAWTVAPLWIIAIFAELTDMFDGMAARRLNQTSDFGRLFDPFADTLLQITGFFCFVIDGIFPMALFLVVLYREFGILFVRNLMLRKGVVMGARKSGKIKTVTYITAEAVALLYVSLRRLGVADCLQPVVKIAAIVVFCVSVLFSVLSFFDYVSVYRSSSGKTE